MLQQNKSLTALKTCSIEFNIANQPFSHLTMLGGNCCPVSVTKVLIPVSKQEVSKRGILIM